MDASITWITCGFAIRLAARDLGYWTAEVFAELRQQVEEVRRMLNGHVAYLKTKKLGEKEPGAHLFVGEDSTGYLSDVEEEETA